MTRKTIVFGGFALFALLYVATLFFRTGPIESDLARRSSSVLATSGLESIGVTLDGRDVVLAGNATRDDEQRAIDLVETVLANAQFQSARFGIEPVDSQYF